MGLEMQEDGCCAINESCSQHYGLFIAAIIISLLVLILLVVLMVFCIRRYLHEKKMNKQQDKEACKPEDLNDDQIERK